jgi:heterodisulfide reductase subunit B
MKYLYYPGCSLEGTAREYDRSTRALFEALEVELVEIEDWTCCGASAAEAQSELLAMALPARNLAAAEAMDSQAADILVPCSACYLNLKRAAVETARDPALLSRVNAALEPEGLALKGRKRVRHLLDVLTTDIGAEVLAERVRTGMSGYTIAPYYGCQCIRPYVVFDDPEAPVSMEPLILATGAGLHEWRMGAQCCGASLMNIRPEIAREMVAAILAGAEGADAIVTVCPMCQMNLEGYQSQVSRAAGRDLRQSVIYLPQFLGLALGLGPDALSLDLNLSEVSPIAGFR